MYREDCRKGCCRFFWRNPEVQLAWLSLPSLPPPGSSRIFSYELNHSGTSSFIRTHHEPPVPVCREMERRFRRWNDDDTGRCRRRGATKIRKRTIGAREPSLIYLERIRMFNNPSSDLRDGRWWSVWPTFKETLGGVGRHLQLDIGLRKTKSQGKRAAGCRRARARPPPWISSQQPTGG